MTLEEGLVSVLVGFPVRHQLLDLDISGVGDDWCAVRNGARLAYDPLTLGQRLKFLGE